LDESHIGKFVEVTLKVRETNTPEKYFDL